MKVDLIKKLRKNSIRLIDEKQFISLKELEKYQRKILVCDAYVEGIEKATPEKGGFRKGNIFVLDHHIPIEQFERNISSTNLAIDYVKKNGAISEDTMIIINHTDCDSILSSLIMRKVLLPGKRFGEAAIEADHTGKKNKIADLLQALQYERNIEFSLKNLQLLLDKKPLELKAQELLQKRYRQRKEIKKIVDKKEFKKSGEVFYIEINKRIDPNFLIPLFPEAKIILSFSPHQKNSNCLEVRMRRGMAASKKLKLNKIGINEFDPKWGGRWNAGSNKRGGGTKLSANKYAKILNCKLQRAIRN